MEQGQEVKELEQVEAVAVGVKAVVAEAKEEVLRQAREAIAFAPIVVKKLTIN